ncbi:hypothetical protein [Nocardia bovistercoris]|uniref:DUF4267 domain-containing protein n=1 Tax=Nocardia bovistercoris TaxID=2785916 RepID=A0A931N0I6_9NOCA|nr:hypothetical protein [Nocardia bovistercoris]MBH0775039.1 hypothetical protein [Nocardia bovistercoris]
MSNPHTDPSPELFPLRVLIAIRATLAIGGLLVPRFGFRLFLMEAAGTPAPVMGRMFAVRNAVIALGLARLDTTRVPRAFLRLNMLIDIVDALAFAASGRRREIGGGAAALGVGVALTAATLGGAVGARMPADPR